ncbi:DUF6466 family protein [Bifidobacterium subtile]|jgi:hypothetical protein|uniref:DUF6466 family protein n=1 Tax=Bifidobacterium subtile TaxID=77635 RepID=UPI002F35146B
MRRNAKIRNNADRGPGNLRKGTRHRTGAIRRTRASRPTRVALIAVAALLTAVATVCGFNIAAIHSYNQATRSLTSNLKSAASPNADLDDLKTRQQQTDEQFDEAGAFGFLLLPQVKTSIHANSQVSKTLTTRTSQEITKQQTGQASSSGTAGKGTLENGQQSDGLSQEQRDKLNDLLKANQQSPSPDDAQSDSGDAAGTDNGNSAVKPW